MRSAAPVLSMDETTTMVGAWAWAEDRLYEVLGGWVASTVGPATKVYFDSASMHHAWRAQLWRERLPARLVAAPGADVLVRPLSDGVETAMNALSNLEGDVGRLAAYCRVVLARTVVAYQDWQRRCSPSSDRPVARVLGIVVADVVGDWQDGCSVLVDLLSGAGGDHAVGDAARASEEIERLWISPGRAPNA
jgi:hypothetical protein